MAKKDHHPDYLDRKIYLKVVIVIDRRLKALIVYIGLIKKVMKKSSTFLLVLLYPLFILSQGQNSKLKATRWDKMKMRVIERSDFKDSVFDETAIFDDTVRFISKADFSHALFASKGRFKMTQFSSIANFYHVEFKSTADFNLTRFDSSAIFNMAQFDSSVSFAWVSFNTRAYFSDVQFLSNVEFRFAWFGATADFSGAHFTAKADFSHVQFSSMLILEKAQFESEIIFDGAFLPKYINLSNITSIATEIDLTSAEINDKYERCNINLIGSDIDKIRFRYNRFRLWFPELDTSWGGGETQIDYELKAGVYEQLLEKQKIEGFTKSYEILDKEYQEFKYSDPKGKYSWLWGPTLNWIDKNWWGYGYDKELVLRNVILIYLLLSLLNAFMLRHLTSSVYVNEGITNRLDSLKDKNWLNKSLTSVRYSLFYTAVIFFGFKFDIDKLKYLDNLDGWHIFNLAYFIFIYLGGIVCLAYLANYIITV